jgi:glutaredoxin
MDNKKLTLTVFITIGLLLAILFVVYSVSVNQPVRTYSPKELTKTLEEKKFIYFFTSTCPVCKQLNDWLKKNKITPEKFGFEKINVENNDNAALMYQAASVCQIPQNQVGVPFIYKGGKCYLGLVEAKKAFDL